MNRMASSILEFYRFRWGLLILLSAALFVGRPVWDQFTTSNFQKTSAMVLKSEVVTRGSGKDEKFEPHLEYSFSASGRTVLGNRLRLGSIPFFNQASALNYVAEHPPQSTVEVWFDPQRPERNMLGQPGLGEVDNSRLFILELLCCGGLASWLGWLRDRSPAGGFPSQNGRFQLSYASPILVALGYLALSTFFVAGPIVMFFRLQPSRALFIPLTIAIFVLVATGLKNFLSGGRLQIQPGTFQLPGHPPQKLQAVVLELVNRENGYSYQLRLKGPDGSLTDSLVELQTWQRAQALGREIARIGQVSLEGSELGCQDHDPLQLPE